MHKQHTDCTGSLPLLSLPQWGVVFSAAPWEQEANEFRGTHSGEGVWIVYETCHHGNNSNLKCSKRRDAMFAPHLRTGHTTQVHKYKAQQRPIDIRTWLVCEATGPVFMTLHHTYVHTYIQKVIRYITEIRTYICTYVGCNGLGLC